MVIQNRAYLPHLITDPHTHPILLLQKLLNFTIPYNQFISKAKNHKLLKQTFQTRDIIVVDNLPNHSIDSDLINLINSFDIPIVMKTIDYHTFVVNDIFLKLVNQTGNVWKEKNFQIVDEIIVRILGKNIDTNFEILTREFLRNGISRTIDAFTTENFYNLYNQAKTKKLNIKFLLDSKFFLKSPEILQDKRVLGIKFFIDGTISSSSAWIDCCQVPIFDEKEFEEILLLLKSIGNKFFLAFHCVGNCAFEFLVKKLASMILKNDNLFLRIEHCTLAKWKDLETLIKLIEDLKYFGRVFLVLNPEKANLNLDKLILFDKWLGICFASDSPVFPLNIKNSIFNYLPNKYLVLKIFEFNNKIFYIKNR